MQQVYLSFLRGVNVGGHKKINMKDLRSAYQAAGFENVMTYIQSGNVVFTYNEVEEKCLQETIEQTILNKFNFEVEVIVRKFGDMENILARHAFYETENFDPKKLYVALLQGEPERSIVDSLTTSSSSKDKFLVFNKEVYIYCEGGFGKTQYNNQYFEKKLGIVSTIRNWNTMEAMLQMGTEVKNKGNEPEVH